MKRFSTFLLGTMVALSMAASPIDLRTSKASLDDVINVVAHNLVEDVYFGYPYVWASDGDYEVYAFLVTDPSSPFGSYDSENCMITLYDADNKAIELSNISATYSEEGGIKRFVATGTGDDLKTYNINVDNDSDPYNADEDADYSHNFTSYEIDDRNLEKYGSLYVKGTDGEFYVYLDITLPKGASELVAGQYPADKKYGYQTFCPGYNDATFGPAPSYAAMLVEEDGKMCMDKIWYIVSGTVTIDENGTITVSGKNSLDHNINVTLWKGTDTAINNAKDDVREKAVKRLVNGKLIIERNGKTFNILGTEIK